MQVPFQNAHRPRFIFPGFIELWCLIDAVLYAWTAVEFFKTGTSETHLRIYLKTAKRWHVRFFSFDSVIWYSEIIFWNLLTKKTTENTFPFWSFCFNVSRVVHGLKCLRKRNCCAVSDCKLLTIAVKIKYEFSCTRFLNYSASSCTQS